MPEVPVDQKADALVNRGVCYGQKGDTEKATADYSEVINLPGVAVDLKASALINRGKRSGRESSPFCWSTTL